MEIAVVTACGFALDLVLGDPSRMPHPIVFIGRMISACETALRKIFPDTPAGERAGGVVLLITVTAVSAGVPYFVIKYITVIGTLIGSPALGEALRYAVEIFWSWQIFACRSLKKESLKVYAPLRSGDIRKARRMLSRIVGRDTDELDEKGVTKAVVETVAENTSDGVTAPMLYMIIGGVPAAFMYKAVNTLDSMVGYRNDRYVNFGTASAKFDDLLNLIPARITGLAMVLGTVFTGMDTKNSWRIFCRDRYNHKSPNSAHPEAAVAGALRVQLAGDARYFGELYKKPTIGDDIRPIEADDIKKANLLMYAASVICLIVFEAVRVAVVMMAG